MTTDDRDPNVLARQLADAHDALESLRLDMAQVQGQWLLERARLELAAGMSVDEIPDHLWEDGPRIAQTCLDMVWDGGYRDGLAVATKELERLREESFQRAEKGD